MKLRIPICFGIVAMVFSGCATNPVIAAKKAGIRTVQLEPRVDARQGMRYGVDLSGGGLGNSLASMLVDSAGQKGITRMSQVMQSNQIVVGELVHQCVVEKLRENTEVKIVDGESDGVFVLTVLQYGFDNPGLQFSQKCPIILLRAELLDRKGKRVWTRDNAPIQLTSKDIGGTWEEYETNPEKLRADWNKQISNVVACLFPKN